MSGTKLTLQQLNVLCGRGELNRLESNANSTDKWTFGNVLDRRIKVTSTIWPSLMQSWRWISQEEYSGCALPSIGRHMSWTQKRRKRLIAYARSAWSCSSKTSTGLPIRPYDLPKSHKTPLQHNIYMKRSSEERNRPKTRESEKVNTGVKYKTEAA